MKKVVGVQLIGGLGNQLFQYAIARALSLRVGAAVALDLSWFGTDPARKYALAPFAIQATLLDPTQTQRDSNSLWARIRRRLGGSARSSYGMPVFSEASFQYDPRVQVLRAPVFLDGYFQSEKYFREVRPQILEDFSLLESPTLAGARMLNEIRSKDAICLHIRRGDYISNPAANAHHGTCSLEYYKTGLELAVNGLRIPHCFVFSDDPIWVRENLKITIPMTLVDIHGPEQAHEDLRLMSACSRFVIANSSLSWWGAWLASVDDKVVIAPRRWFANDNMNTTDLLPPSWIRI